MRRVQLALAVALGVGCSKPSPVVMAPVRLYAAHALPGALVTELAHTLAIADPVLVDRVEDAEVAWLMDPTAALALGALAAPGSAPEQPGVPSAFLDLKHRFAPVGAVARVIVASERRVEPFAPHEISTLADARVRGKVALSRLDRGDGPLLAAALEAGYGERAALGWLRLLAANQPILLERDADVAVLVAAGNVPFGLIDSLTAGAAAQRGGLRVVFTDQKGQGCIAIPTALVVLPNASAGARRFSAWLAGPAAEAVLVERAIGLLPLRTGASAPSGMLPVWRLAVLSLDWSVLAERKLVWERRLAGWPKQPRGSR